MLSNLKLGTQLRGGFGVIVGLLILVSLIAYSGLSNTYSGFAEYRSLAQHTNLAGRVQANMLMVRLSVLSFLNNGSQGAIDQYDERQEMMRKFLDEAKVEIQDSSRAGLIREVTSEVSNYEKGFYKVTDLFAKRNLVVASRLDPAGLAMRVAITELVQSAYKDGDADVTYSGAVVEEHLLLGRLFVTKYLVTNVAKDAERATDELDNQMVKALGKLKAQVKNPDRRALIATIEKQYQIYAKAFSDVRDIIIERNDLIENTLNRVGPIVANKIEQVKLSVKEDQDALGPEVQIQVEYAKNLVSLISLLAVIAGISIAILMTKVIRRPIGGEPMKIAEVTNCIAKGDLSQELPLTESDTGIYRSVVEMSGHLAGLIRSLKETSISLTLSSQESSELASNNQETVFQQKQMIDQVVVAVEEMSNSIEEVVRNAAASASKSELGREEAITGREAVKITMQAVNELSNNLSSSMLVINDLERQSNEIGSVVEVIKGISEQTNLLALNAAIEAARAGEQGRGFAVVADEVRTLAQRTQESTSEIQTIIQNLQQGTAHTVAAMDKSTAQAAETVERSTETDAALATIYDVINEIADMNTQVAAAVEEQSAVAIDISRNMTEISNKLDDTTEAVSKAQASSNEVNHMASELNTLASFFKV